MTRITKALLWAAIIIGFAFASIFELVTEDFATTMVIVLPLLAPSLVQALGLIFLLGRNGVISRAFGIEIEIYGFWGLLIANTLYALPQAVMIIGAALVLLDARTYDIVPIAAPRPEEAARPYLWRFWRHIPRSGYMTIYDRSWYGRVLVERVEGFAEEHEWRRSYEEINNFEEHLIKHGTTVIKFWINISFDEQLRRFQERQQIPWKQHKITEEDWRNREKWEDYKLAVNDMVAHTSTEKAPWVLVAGNDKKYARVQILNTVCKRLEAALSPD